MRVGLVCPYSLDVPGGVQNHVDDLASSLLQRGHAVSVLAPAGQSGGLPEYVVPAGRAVPVPYNGSVARLTFGPLSMSRARRWLRAGDFDVVHVHEPTTPSLSMLVLAASEVPVVATFHTATERSRALAAAAGFLGPTLDKIAVRIAVSEFARRTLVRHLGGTAVVVPNGLFVKRFAGRTADPAYASPGGTLAFLGRFDEPRKGLPVLLEAFERVVEKRPEARLLVAGRGTVSDARRRLSRSTRERVEFLGAVSDETRAELLASADVFVAPNLGGESFGIVLIEAMAAGTAVVASDIPAFRAVLDGGRFGWHFRNGDADDLAGVVLAVLDDPDAADRVAAGARDVWRYDWSTVSRRIQQAYASVSASAPRRTMEPYSTPRSPRYAVTQPDPTSAPPQAADQTPHTGTARVKRGMAEMLKGGVIMDVVTPEQAKIAEDAGAVSVMALERVPADIRVQGGVARMSDPDLIDKIIEAVSIPVMAKARIGHFAEAQVLQALGVDYVDESEVLTPADESHHIDKWAFTVPFVCGATNLGEALRRLSEGAAMIRSKGEAGTGNVVEATRHMRQIRADIRRLGTLDETELFGAAKELRAPVELVKEVAEAGKLPVVLFTAGGIATPADAAMMMQLGAEGVFVGSGIFKSGDPAKRAEAIVKATTFHDDPAMVAKVSRGLGEPMVGINLDDLAEGERYAGRGW